MSSNIFLAPCDPGNFRRTVLNPLDPSTYSNAPEPIADRNEVRFWGVRDGKQNRTYFEKMEGGDTVLFYQNGAYIGVASIKETFEDTDGWARTNFWQGAPSTLIYTLGNFTEIEVPRAAVNRLFDYNEDTYPQGLMRVSDTRVNNSPRVIKRTVEKYHEKHC
ncbi:hypothetical protein [Halobacterium sp. R2-5]|uniref:hypothetical protein n=1 Tax=Halobacterium sp. R2-5 TaxID=2715751 RepID=UPI0014213B83|nr:hypothetical protein [Halobacterium sp. R2-5]NIC00225.1 hypothetical protein [Halobacterium sp. R2-5]